jgi:hypothetical protein
MEILEELVRDAQRSVPLGRLLELRSQVALRACSLDAR